VTSPNCPKCGGAGAGSYETDCGKPIISVLLKVFYVCAAILTYALIYNFIAATISLSLAMLAAWIDYKLPRYYKCSNCGEVYGKIGSE